MLLQITSIGYNDFRDNKMMLVEHRIYSRREIKYMPDGTNITSEDLKKMLQEVKQHSDSIKDAIKQNPGLVDDLSDEERNMITEEWCGILCRRLHEGELP